MTEADLWAESGAMELTGRADGPALPCVGAPATAVQDALDALAALGVAELPDIRLLSDRARSAGFRRSAPFSAGGSFQILPTADGWFGVTLARPTDFDLVPALIESDDVVDPWGAMSEWLAGVSSSVAVERTALLGLPAAPVPRNLPPPRRPSVRTIDGGERTRADAALVVDLTSLWAGPLCAHLLGLAGSRVIKVESSTRPDASRIGTPDFFELLHRRHESVVLDFAAARRQLQALIREADVILEASRPRALEQIGIVAADEVARGAIWVSITAYGRSGSDHMRVGFGDDVAAGAGLVAWEGDVPYPAGDALADPLTGVSAAVAAVAALERSHGVLLDVSMHDVSAAAAVR